MPFPAVPRAAARGTADADFGPAFCENLIERVDIAKAAERAGTNIIEAYRCRRRDPAFAADWEAARAAAYDELEMALLRRARFGTRRPVKRADGKQGYMTEYDDAQALRLLLAHRQTERETKADPADNGDRARRRLDGGLAALRRAETDPGEAPDDRRTDPA